MHLKLNHAIFLISRAVLWRGFHAVSLAPTRATRTVSMDFNETQILWFEEITSTMDKARELVNEKYNNGNFFSVVASKQTNGRGTRGRTWISEPRNLFMTSVFKLKSVPIPINLVPLRIGTLVAPSIQSRVFSGQPVYLKWPNDVLIGDRKVCGILIEVEGDQLLVGIGCNVRSSPTVEGTGPEGGRQGTCLADHAAEMTEQDLDAPSDGEEGVSAAHDIAKEIAEEISGSIAHWLSSADAAEAVRADFEKMMDTSLQSLRIQYFESSSSAECTGEGRGGTPSPSCAQSAKGPQVQPLGINKDGTLKVRLVEDGTVRDLVADYLW